MLNLLAESLKGNGEELSSAAIQSLVGFIIVIAGIAVLIGILFLAGVITNALSRRPKKKTGEKAMKAIPAKSKKARGEEGASEHVSNESPVAAEAEEEVPSEVKAAIVAAIMAFYQAEKPKAEFRVKRIKRLY